MLLCTGVLLTSPPASAQVADVARRLVEAREHEDHANFEEALHIYRELYAVHSGRVDILYRIEAVLSRLGRHADVVDLMTQRLEQAPGDINARLKRGDARFALGRRDAAFEDWEAILENAGDQSPFLIVADYYRRHNLHDRVEAVYARARRQLQSPALFAREMAQLAEGKGRYDQAVAEYLRFIDDKPQYVPVIQQHLREFAENEAQRGPVFRHLAAETLTRPGDRARSLLLVDYAAAAGMLADALTVLQSLADPAPGAPWEEAVRQVARQSLDAGGFDTAAGAFSMLLQSPDQRAAALMGLAMAEEGRKRFAEAARWYEVQLAEAGAIGLHQQARYRLGRMLAHEMDDVDAALAAILPLLEDQRRTEWRDRAEFEAAALFVRADRLDEAMGLLVRNVVQSERPDDADRARHLAVLLAGAPTRYVLNDALEASSLIDEGRRDFPRTLSLLARATRLLRQKQPRAAADLLSKAAGDPPEQAGLDRILDLRIEALQAAGDPQRVVDACLRLLSETPESPLCPGARLTMAATFEAHLAQPVRAREIYEQILLDTPASLEADEARIRLRRLQERPPAERPAKETG